MALNPKTTRTFQASEARQTSLFQAQQRGDRPTGKGRDGNFSNGSAFKSQAQKESIRLIEDGVNGWANAQIAKEHFRNSLAAAEQFGFNAKQEEIKGRQVSNKTAAEVNRVQASNMVLGFASGVNASGSITRAQEIIGRKGAINQMFARTDAAIKAGALRRAKKLKEEQARYDLKIAEYNSKVAPLKIVAGALIAYFSGGQA